MIELEVEEPNAAAVRLQEKKKSQWKILALLISPMLLIVVLAWRWAIYRRSLPHLEIVFAYYHAPLLLFHGYSAYIHYYLSWHFNIKKTVYVKKDFNHADDKLLRMMFDNVHYLDNVGREGATYLHHIVTNYDNLPDKVFFLQAHSQWHALTHGRLFYADADTGFLSFGPYIHTECGKTWPGDYFQMKRIWKMFTETECPEGESQLASWSGQFITSKDRIRSHPIEKYKELLRLMTAPPDDPIYDETPSDWPTQNHPLNPYLGHALERSWPIIFNCRLTLLYHYPPLTP